MLDLDPESTNLFQWYLYHHLTTFRAATINDLIEFWSHTNRERSFGKLVIRVALGAIGVIISYLVLTKLLNFFAVVHFFVDHSDDFIAYLIISENGNEVFQLDVYVFIVSFFLRPDGMHNFPCKMMILWKTNTNECFDNLSWT